MTRFLTPSFVVMAVLAGSLTACSEASAASANQVIFQSVQHTPQYDVSRPEVPSGATITLFANFLGSQQGYVMFHLNGTSTQCEVVDWKDNSVTAVLPRLGLAGPKNAEIQLVRPDGRVVKTFRILFVRQPDVLVHSDTVPQPLPPAPAAGNTTYASPVPGGVALYAQ